MRVPLVDLAAQHQSNQAETSAAIRGVIERTDFVSGLAVNRFEQAFAGYLGCAGAAGVSSGTAALHLCLVACGIGPGDEVIVPSLTFAATAEAVVHVGARPIVVDVEEPTGLIDVACIERALTSRTKAVIAVHLYGQAADQDSLNDIAKIRGLWLIEDAAQAHGACYKGRRCGTIGHFGCFSFCSGKNLGAYGDAGAVVGNDITLVDRVRRRRDHGRCGKSEHCEVGFGERLDTIQAAILRPSWLD